MPADFTGHGGACGLTSCHRLWTAQLVQYALARLRAEVLPAYEADDGPLSAATIKKLKKLM